MALLGHDLPLAGFQQIDVNHAIFADDRRTHVRGALGHGVAGAGGVHVAIVKGPGTGDDTRAVDEGVDTPDFVGPDDVHPVADVLGNIGDVFEPLEFGLDGGQANSATAMPTRVLAR